MSLGEGRQHERVGLGEQLRQALVRDDRDEHGLDATLARESLERGTLAAVADEQQPQRPTTDELSRRLHESAEVFFGRQPTDVDHGSRRPFGPRGRHEQLRVDAVRDEGDPRLRRAARHVRGQLGRRADHRRRRAQTERRHGAAQQPRPRVTREALVPESIARDERHTEAPASDHRGQAASGLEDAHHVAVANDRAVTKRQQHAVECCGMPAAGHEAHALEHGRIAREVLEAFRQVAEVHDAAKGGRVRP